MSDQNPSRQNLSLLVNWVPCRHSAKPYGSAETEP
jgi:hypothetical protein